MNMSRVPESLSASWLPISVWALQDPGDFDCLVKIASFGLEGNTSSPLTSRAVAFSGSLLN